MLHTYLFIVVIFFYCNGLLMVGTYILKCVQTSCSSPLSPFTEPFPGPTHWSPLSTTGTHLPNHVIRAIYFFRNYFILLDYFDIAGCDAFLTRSNALLYIVHPSLFRRCRRSNLHQWWLITGWQRYLHRLIENINIVIYIRCIDVFLHRQWLFIGPSKTQIYKVIKN